MLLFTIKCYNFFYPTLEDARLQQTAGLPQCLELRVRQEGVVLAVQFSRTGHASGDRHCAEIHVVPKEGNGDVK